MQTRHREPRAARNASPSADLSARPFFRVLAGVCGVLLLPYGLFALSVPEMRKSVSAVWGIVGFVVGRVLDWRAVR